MSNEPARLGLYGVTDRGAALAELSQDYTGSFQDLRATFVRMSRGDPGIAGRKINDSPRWIYLPAVSLAAANLRT